MHKPIAKVLVALGLIVSATGCQNTNTGIVALTAEERKLATSLAATASKNQVAADESLDLLGRLSETYAAQEHTLALDIAKAKLLEALNSFNAPKNEAVARSRKAVALYLLFELAQADQEARQASIEAKRASIDAIKQQYAGIVTILGTLDGQLGKIDADLTKAPPQQVQSFVAEFFKQVKAFQTTIAASDNPKLKALAVKVGKAEDQAEKVRTQINDAINVLIQVKE